MRDPKLLLRPIALALKSRTLRINIPKKVNVPLSSPRLEGYRLAHREGKRVYQDLIYWLRLLP
jgi:hypothetical protein